LFNLEKWGTGVFLFLTVTAFGLAGTTFVRANDAISETESLRTEIEHHEEMLELKLAPIKQGVEDNSQSIKDLDTKLDTILMWLQQNSSKKNG